MCIKQLKEVYKRDIYNEKNVHIRERHEDNVKKQMDVILGVLLAGGFTTFAKTLISLLIFSSLTIFLLVVYLFITNTYLKEYARYTDELIRGKDDKKKSKSGFFRKLFSV